MANSDRMTIYMNEQDKQTVTALMDALTKKGVDLKGKGNKPSVSELFRYLVKQELSVVKK
jgi:hypothetical protein